MRKLSYLCMGVMLLTGITARGQGTFNPSSPAEPGAPSVYSQLVLLMSPTNDAGSVSGGGKHLVNTDVRVYAYTNSGFQFTGWTDTKGNVLSNASSFYFTNTEKADTLIANYRFVPASPSEPVEPSTILYYQLTLIGNTGCSGVSGGGKYLAGKNVSVSASTETGYNFLNWTNSKGKVVSTARSFSYTTQAYKDTLYANFVFNPTPPTEPEEPVLRHKVRADASEGGTWSGTTGLIYEGKSFSLTASANTGYTFEGWYLNGELYTTLRSFSYTMEKQDLDFYAKFKFNPASPAEPNMPALDLYSFYLMTVNGAPGWNIDFPLYYVGNADVYDMNFRLTFPTQMMPDMSNITVSELAEGYETSISALNDSVYQISLIGGHTPVCTTKMLTFHVSIGEDMPTGVSYQVKINQISVTMEDGTTVTTRTRNGRMGVYKLGDVNGDDNINILDVISEISLMKGSDDESLIREVSDTNLDENLNILDVVGILEIMKSNTETNDDNE